MHHKLINLLAIAGRRLAAATDGFRQRRASVNEIARMDRQEMGCLAQDLGVSPDELRILSAKGRNAADLLTRRMESVGLDPARVDSSVMRDLQRCCSTCIEKGRCVHELEDQPRDPAWPKYCPNEQTLAALTEEQRRLPMG